MTGSVDQLERRDLSSRAAAAIAECRLLATMTEEPGRTTRRYLSPPVAEVHAHLRKRMEALGMTVTVDAAGNLRGLWTPPKPGSKRLILGSHIDTVPDAGAFDGVLGVVLALEWVDLARQLTLTSPIEVIAFSEEEGVRYGIPFLGSRAVAGVFDRSLLNLTDAKGIRMDEAIRNFGLDPEKIADCLLNDQVIGFIEIHIEQGPVLDSEGLGLATVEGIAGQSRLTLRFSGQANHAGTTPMRLRRDALTAAAEWILAVESAAQGVPGLVATVGKIAAQPNAGNVIPGIIDLTLDVRHILDHERLRWVAELIQIATQIADRRSVALQWTEQSSQNSVLMDAHLTARLAIAVEAAGFAAAGFKARKLPSGAGHDAMIMATVMPTAMLFLRSPGGISHHPDETVLAEDVEAALLVGKYFLAEPNIPKRSKSNSSNDMRP